jgi:hypothetical protein
MAKAMAAAMPNIRFIGELLFVLLKIAGCKMSKTGDKNGPVD